MKPCYALGIGLFLLIRESDCLRKQIPFASSPSFPFRFVPEESHPQSIASRPPFLLFASSEDPHEHSSFTSHVHQKRPSHHKYEQQSEESTSEDRDHETLAVVYPERGFISELRDHENVSGPLRSWIEVLMNANQNHSPIPKTNDQTPNSARKLHKDNFHRIQTANIRSQERNVHGSNNPAHLLHQNPKVYSEKLPISVLHSPIYFRQTQVPRSETVGYENLPINQKDAWTPILNSNRESSSSKGKNLNYGNISTALHASAIHGDENLTNIALSQDLLLQNSKSSTNSTLSINRISKENTYEYPSHSEKLDRTLLIFRNPSLTAPRQSTIPFLSIPKGKRNRTTLTDSNQRKTTDGSYPYNGSAILKSDVLDKLGIPIHSEDLITMIPNKFLDNHSETNNLNHSPHRTEYRSTQIQNINPSSASESNQFPKLQAHLQKLNEDQQKSATELMTSSTPSVSPTAVSVGSSLGIKPPVEEEFSTFAPYSPRNPVTSRSFPITYFSSSSVAHTSTQSSEWIKKKRTNTEESSRSPSFPPSGTDFEEHNVPGRAGLDYPIFNEIPFTNFNCAGYKNPGFYADMEVGCQIFHNCDMGMKKHSFICPNGTIFHQQLFICDWWYNVRCDDSPEFFKLNEGLYQEYSEDDTHKEKRN